MDQLEGVRATYSDSAMRKAASCFRRIVIWGLYDYGMTHRHIFRAFHQTCKKLELPVIWVTDNPSGTDITSDDIVFIHGSCRNLGYLLSRNPVIVEFNATHYQKELGPDFERLINYDRRITEVEAKHSYKTDLSLSWDAMTYYNPELRYLSQPWGSDLLPQDFYPPVNSTYANVIYWVGTWWLNSEWGNFDEMATMKSWADNQGLDLRLLGDCDAERNALFVRLSRFAPAIGGAGQTKANYLACRMFKNISYGQFCVSNVPLSQQLLDNSALFSEDLPSLFDRAMSVSAAQSKEMTLFQQHKIRNYTIAAHLYVTFVAAIVYCCKESGA